MNTTQIANIDYADWLQSISKRYRQSQIKAAVAVNTEMLRFYFGLGADIVRMEKDQPWGKGFLKRLSIDLKMQMPEADCFSPTNLAYMRRFFRIYEKMICPQVGGELNGLEGSETGAAIYPQVGGKLYLHTVQRICAYTRDLSARNSLPLASSA